MSDFFYKEIERDNSEMADAMRYLFDITLPLHQNLFQSEETQQTVCDPSIIEKYSEEEVAWRKSLVVGSKVDAIKVAMEFNLKMWAKGEIVSVNGDIFYIVFENDLRSFSARHFHWYSPEIDRYNTKSEGDEWRLELKAGDFIDGFDSTKIWYQATVQDRQFKIDEGREILHIKVGFRIFHPDGNKEDDDKRKYFGWSESFDDWIPAFNPRIQKFQSFAKTVDDAQQNQSSIRYEETIDDQMDMLLYSNNPGVPVFAVTRRRCKSKLLVQFLNHFGELGGFQRIHDRLNLENNEQLGLETVYYYLDSLAKSTCMFNKSFMNDYLPLLEQAVKKKLLTASEVILRNIKKDRIDGIVSCLIMQLQSRIKSYKQRDQDKNLFNLDIGCLFLEQNFLERRIDGAKILQDVAKSSNLSSYTPSIQDTVYNNLTKQMEHAFIAKVIQRLKEKKVLFQIFSKERGHLQLVQRSEELLKLLIIQNALTEEEMEFVWNSTRIDETTKLELYKVFNELASRLRVSEVTFIINQINHIPLNKIVMEELELVHELAKRSRGGESEYGRLAVEFVWKIAFNNLETLDKALVNQAALAFSDIIKNWKNDHKLVYVERIISNIKDVNQQAFNILQNNQCFLSIKILQRILKDFSGVIVHNNYDNYQDPEHIMQVDQIQGENQQHSPLDKFQSKATFLEFLQEKYDFLAIFLQNFTQYMFKARSGYRKKIESEPNVDKKTLSDKVLADKFIHSEQLNERLEFIKFFTSQSNIKLSKENLVVLWEELVVHSLFIQDSDMFYRWLKELCDSQFQGDFMINLKDLIDFFREQINNESKVFQFITVEGYNCIQSFFLLINESSKKLVRLNQALGNSGQQEVQKFTAYSNDTGHEYKSYSFNQNKNQQNTSSDEDVEFQILVPPHELETIDGIWNIAIDSHDSRVTEKTIAFLIKLYSCVTFRLEPQLAQFEDDFIRKCIDNINKQKEIILARTEEPKEEYEKVEKPLAAFIGLSSSILQRVLPPEEKKLLRYMLLLKELIKNSEKDGTLGVKSHAALFKGEYLHTIQVTNSLRNGIKYQNKIEFGVHSNTTIWDLRRIIGERVSRVYASEEQNSVYYQDAPCHPATVRLYRFSGATDIKDVENGKTLAELRFKPNEQLTAFRRNIFFTTKVPLVNETNDDLSDRAKYIFTSWFNMYSIEDPDNPGRRVMTPATAVIFTKSCTEDNCTEEDSRVVGLFAMYDPDQDGKIQIEDFLVFYKACVFEKEEVVRQNLMAHYYRYDLRKQPIDGYDENMMQLRQSKYDMPRYKLADNSFYFESIFALLERQGDVSYHAWSLIKTMTTNPPLYKKVLTLNKDPEFQWDQIFDASNIYKMLYTLQIVESLLETDRNNQDIQETQDESLISEEAKLKKDWTERFLSSNGFQQILKLFQKSLNMISQKSMDGLSKFEKNFLEYMLKLIRIFILSAFSANDQSVYELINLVKKVSNVPEDKENQGEQPQQTDTEENAGVNNQFKTPSKVQPKIQIMKRGNKNDVDIKAEDINEQAIFGDDYGKDPTDFVCVQDKEPINTHSAQQQKLENDSERFTELANIMRESGLGEVILNKIDFKILQNEVLEVASLILNKKEISSEDVLIMENALSLWVASLIKNDNLFDDFFDYTRNQENPNALYGIKTAEDLVVTGIYTYKSYRVREEFCNTFVCIAQKVKKNQKTKPLYYLLDIMKRNFPREDTYYATRECKQYFDMFIQLVDEYIGVKKNEIANTAESSDHEKLIDPYDLLREAIEKLKKHETKEKKNSILEDKTLIGYFQLIEKLIVYLQTVDKARLQEVVEETNIIHELFYENLFYHPLYAKSQVENKSKCKESRAACYSLFIKVLESLEPRELADFMEDNLWPLIKDLPRPQKWKYVPSENAKNTQFVGIVNLGCICYMISMLQQFFMVPQFRYQLLKAEDNSSEDIKEYKGRKVDDNLLRQLQRMYGYLELSEKQAYDPLEFCFAMKDFEGNPTNTAIQQDAQEFLNIFFDRVEEYLKPTTQKHLLEGVFGGKVCSQLICQSCGNVRNILESFYNLSLPVKDRKGLEDSLQKMIEGSLINDYQCDACKQRVDVYKRSLIAETPNVLIVHLQRIIFNFDTFQNDKINTRFDFPNVLNLKEFSFKEVMKAEGRPEDQIQQENVKHLLDMGDDEFNYKLVGVIIHRGTAEHGHYYSLINTKRGSDELDETKPEWVQTDKDPWKEFNDETVKYFSFGDLKTEAFGGNSGANNYGDSEMSAYLVHSGTASSYGQNAYMLVYDRMKKKPLKEIIKKEDNKMEIDSQNDAAQLSNTVDNDTAALECADTATSRVVQEQELSEILIPYRKVEPYVPEWIRRQILSDNSTFIMDRYIYHESFFNLLKNIYKHVANKLLLSQHQYKLDYIPHFTRLKKMCMEIGHKTMFELLAYYYYNTQMSDITNSLQSIIQFCDSHYTMSRNQDSILQQFLQKSFLDDDCTHFFNIMFDCGDKTSRYYVGKLTSFVMNKIYSIWDEAENKEAPNLIKLRESADYLLKKWVNKLKSSDCQKNWSRFEQFLKLIHDIGCGGKYQVHFLLSEFDIAVELIDFMLGNNSPIARQRGEKRPTMGSVGNNPPFEPLVSLVCFLARFSMTTQMINERHTWDLLNNPPPTTLLGYNVVVDTEKSLKYPLSDRSASFIVQSGFLERFLKDGIECEELGKLLAHFCYQNESLSINLCKTLLHGISRNDFDKVKNYLDVVTQLALIRDNYQRKRLEWIFGVGSLVCHTSTISRANDNNEVRTKMGIKVLQSANDEVFTYRSALIYDSIDDALLHLLWRYKGKMDAYAVNCLYSLLNLIAQDDNVAQYFSEVPGPTYFYARYTDWIKPYLYEQLIDARKGYAGSFSAQKEEIVVKALSLYEKYEKFIEDQLAKANIKRPEPTPLQKLEQQIQENEQKKEKMIIDQNEPEEENVKNLIPQEPEEQIKPQIEDKEDESKVIQCVPTPYIIVDCVGEKVVLYNDFEGVSLTISELSCLYTTSKPTGNHNLALPKNLFRKTYNYAMYGRGIQSTHNAQEKDMQAQCINNYFQSSTFKKKNNGNAKVEDLNTTAGEGHMNDNNEPIVFKDDNNQWDMVNNMNVSGIEEDDPGYNQDQEDGNFHQKDGGIKRTNSGIDQGLNSEPLEMEQVTYKIQVIEEGQINENNNPDYENVNFSGQINYKDENNQDQQQNQNDGGINDNINQQEETDQNQESIIWPYDVNLCEDLVYKITVENRRDFPVKVEVLFTDKDPVSDACNLAFPKGGMKAMAYSNQTKTVILLHKLVPDQIRGEINKLRIELYWKQKNRQNYGNQYESYSNQTSTLHTNDQKKIDEQGKQLEVIEDVADNDDIMLGSGYDPQINVSDSNINLNGEADVNGDSGTAVPGMKQCPQCTLYNDANNIQCEVCEFSLL